MCRSRSLLDDGINQSRSRMYSRVFSGLRTCARLIGWPLGCLRRTILCGVFRNDIVMTHSWWRQNDSTCDTCMSSVFFTAAILSPNFLGWRRERQNKRKIGCNTLIIHDLSKNLPLPLWEKRKLHWSNYTTLSLLHVGKSGDSKVVALITKGIYVWQLPSEWCRQRFGVIPSPMLVPQSENWRH